MQFKENLQLPVLVVERATDSWSQTGCLRWSHTWAHGSTVLDQDPDPQTTGGHREASTDGLPGRGLSAGYPVHQGGSEGLGVVEAEALWEGEKPPHGLQPRD